MYLPVEEILAESEKNAFTRPEFYELGFDWYGYDSFGNIAQFEAMTLPIPKRVFCDPEEYARLAEYFRRLPPVTAAGLTERFARKHRNSLMTVLLGGPNFNFQLNEAKRGLYSIEEYYDGEVESYDDGTYCEGCYYLIAKPERPLKFDSLPEDIKELIKPYYIQINFADIDRINIVDFIECDI